MYAIRSYYGPHRVLARGTAAEVFPGQQDPGIPVAAVEIAGSAVHRVRAHEMGELEGDVLGHIGGVITSYSIHYTKLYDAGTARSSTCVSSSIGRMGAATVPPV